jgi:hypothetical protein
MIGAHPRLAAVCVAAATIEALFGEPNWKKGELSSDDDFVI